MMALGGTPADLWGEGGGRRDEGLHAGRRGERLVALQQT